MQPVEPYSLFPLLFLTLIGSAVYEVIRKAIAGHRRSDDPYRLVPRNADVLVDALFRGQLLLVFLAAAFVVVDTPSLSDFGFASDGPHWLVPFAVGVVCYLLFLVVYGLALRAIGALESLSAAAYLSMRTLLPRSGMARKKLYAVLLINPFTEELLYRGFLVYYLGKVSGYPLLFVGVGLIACLAVHAYQGLRMMLFHTGFYFVAVALLYSPFGIVACFGYHLAGDLIPFTQIRANRAAFRRERRRVRTAARALTKTCE